ncbi:hypothetical protein KY342_00735 [Candidatus Woesearchaeota archaeon]|nr:hypothetical protein [Candidatus Woesearchaeota archaeon]
MPEEKKEQIAEAANLLKATLEKMMQNPKYQAQPDQPQQPESPQPSEQPQTPKITAIGATGGAAKKVTGPVAAYTGESKSSGLTAAVHVRDDFTNVDADVSRDSEDQIKEQLEGSGRLEEAFETSYKQRMTNLREGLDELLGQASTVGYDPTNFNNVLDQTEMIYSVISEIYHKYENGEVEVNLDNYSKTLKQKISELKSSSDRLNKIDKPELEERNNHYLMREINKDKQALVMDYKGKIDNLIHIIGSLGKDILIHHWVAKTLRDLKDVDKKVRKNIEEKNVDSKLVNKDLKQNYDFFLNKGYPNCFYKRGLEREVSREFPPDAESPTNLKIVNTIEKTMNNLGFEIDNVYIIRLITEAETLDSEARDQELKAVMEAKDREGKQDILGLANQIEELRGEIEKEKDGDKDEKLRRLNSISGSFKKAEGYYVEKIENLRKEVRARDEILEKREYRIKTVADEVDGLRQKLKKERARKGPSRWGWFRKLVAAAALLGAAWGAYEYKISSDESLRDDVAQLTSKISGAYVSAEDAVKKEEEAVAARKEAEEKANNLERQVERFETQKDKAITGKQQSDGEVVKLIGQVERLETEKKRIEDELTKAKENKVDPAKITDLNKQLEKANKKASDAIKVRDEVVAVKTSLENQVLDFKNKYKSSEERNKVYERLLNAKDPGFVKKLANVIKEKVAEAKASGDPARVAELEGKLTEANEKASNALNARDEAVAAKKDFEGKLTDLRNKYETDVNALRDQLARASGADPRVFEAFKKSYGAKFDELKKDYEKQLADVQKELAEAKRAGSAVVAKPVKPIVSRPVSKKGIDINKVDPERLKLMKQLFGH